MGLVGVLLTAGFVAAVWCALAGRLGVDGRFAKLALAAGLGLGISSLSFFWLGWSIAPGPIGHALGEAVLLAIAGIALLRQTRPRQVRDRDPSVGEATGADAGLWLARGLTLMCVALAGSALLRAALDAPHGGWDAWAVWNLKARFLFRDVAGWHAAFSDLRPWSCPDYPLLLPGSVARLWTYLGRETTLVPMVIGVGFSGATVALLHGAATRLSGAGQGLMVVWLFLGHAPAWLHGASQYADVPLGFYMLAALYALVVHDRAGAHRADLLLLAGLAAGLATWTKNEGLLFVVAIALGRVMLAASTRSSAPLRGLVPLAAGAAPALLTTLYFQRSVAPVGLHLDGAASRFEKLVDPERYALIFRSFGSEVLWIGPGLVVAIGLYCVLARGFTSRVRCPEILGLAAVLGFMLAGYAAVYVVTPLELGWHLNTSLDRLLIGLWPSALLLFALVAPRPSAILNVWRPQLAAIRQ